MADKIYTRRGDDGTTGILGGGRLGKDDVRLEAMGAVDELNAALGMARASMPAGLGASDAARLDTVLETLQQRLFDLGCHVATPPETAARGLPRVDDRLVDWLEGEIDRHEADLPLLTEFILPGGGALAAALHFARASCRRAERRLVALDRQRTLDAVILRTINRLGDLLFVLARWAAHRAGHADTLWRPAPSEL